MIDKSHFVVYKIVGVSHRNKETMRTTTGVSLPSELKRAAERQARREHRSLSSLISFTLARYLREVGGWDEADPDETEGVPEQP